MIEELRRREDLLRYAAKGTLETKWLKLEPNGKYHVVKVVDCDSVEIAFETDAEGRVRLLLDMERKPTE